MLQHMFATMNELLDDILKHYPSAKDKEKQELDQQLTLLHSMSDQIVEEWLRFEEKLALVRTQNNIDAVHFTAQGGMNQASAGSSSTEAGMPGNPASSAKLLQACQDKIAVKPAVVIDETESEEAIQCGQGYFVLKMYSHAIRHLEQAVRIQPDSMKARIYLGYSYLLLGRAQEACNHFHFMIPLTDNNKLKALAYNALGCISAMQKNTEKAQHYFQKSHFADPTIPEPISNIKVCMLNSGSLQYGEKRMEYMA